MVDRGLNESRVASFLVPRAVNLTAEEYGNYILLSEGEKTRNKERGCQCSLKNGNRKQFWHWFCNVDTLVTEKFSDLKSFLSEARSVRRLILLFDAKLNFSVVIQSPEWHRLNCYNMKHKSMNTDQRTKIATVFWYKREVNRGQRI